MRESYWNELVSEESNNVISSVIQIVDVLNLLLFESGGTQFRIRKSIRATEPKGGRKIV